MKLCVDLCSGLGGFSQAFQEDSEWQVVTVELEKKFKPTVCADVRYLPLKKNLEPEVLLASPPCNHFSLACLQFPRIGVKLALEIVGACFEAVAWLKPKLWLIENPRGRLRKFIGKPKQTIRYSDYDRNIKMMKTTDLWGTLFLPMVNHERHIRLSSGLKGIERLHKNFPAPHPSKYHEGKKITGRDLQAERAKIPKGVSEAVKEGAELLLANKEAKP
jgi:hypothetical protein